MKPSGRGFRRVGAQRVCAVLLTLMALTSVGYAQTFTSGEKGKVKGTTLSRKCDLVKVQDDKTGSTATVKITDDTKIVRDKSKVSVHLAAIVHALSIPNAEGKSPT